MGTRNFPGSRTSLRGVTVTVTFLSVRDQEVGELVIPAQTKPAEDNNESDVSRNGMVKQQLPRLK
jgi:hypothetical protein